MSHKEEIYAILGLIMAVLACVGTWFALPQIQVWISGITQQPITQPAPPAQKLEQPVVTGPTHLEAMDWIKIYDAATMDGWPAWCVRPGDDRKPIRQLSPTEADSTCFNEAFNQTLEDFAIEWTVRVDGRAALLVFGQDNTFYWIAVRANEGFLVFNKVLDFDGNNWQGLGDVFPSTIRTEARALNTVRAARLGSTITFSVNGEEVKVIPDALFEGQPTSIKVGFGATVHGDTGTTVYLKELGVYTPVR